MADKKITDLVEITAVTGDDFIEVSQDQGDASFLSKKFTLGTIANLNYWSGTQAQYDALGTYDSDTIYFIEAV